ncbi:hypothetical protein BH23GEM10_BH23GEM10_09700 [soil metagenome]
MKTHTDAVGLLSAYPDRLRTTGDGSRIQVLACDGGVFAQFMIPGSDRRWNPYVFAVAVLVRTLPFLDPGRMAIAAAESGARQVSVLAR